MTEDGLGIVKELVNIEIQLNDLQTKQISVVDSVYTIRDTVLGMQSQLEHTHAQMDILNGSINVANNYSIFTAVNSALIAALIIFVVGYLVVKGR